MNPTPAFPVSFAADENRCLHCQHPVASQDRMCPCCGASLPVARHLPAGHLLQHGRYRVGGVLGEGGFGITYQAFDTVFEQPVALKELFLEGWVRGKGGLVLAADAARQQQEVQQFVQEARVLAGLTHPGIVRILDTFVENHTRYLAMELLEGKTLEGRLEEGRMPVDEVRGVVMQVLSALGHLHDRQVLHRDIKPANLFLTRDGRCVLMDFGTARTFNLSGKSSHTRTFTPGYAAPEQYLSDAQVGPFTDLYMLGVTVLEMLTGRRVAGAVERLQGASLPDFSGLPLEWRVFLEGTLALRVQERFGNAALARDALTAAVPEGSQQAPKGDGGAQEAFREGLKALKAQDVLGAARHLRFAAQLGHVDAVTQVGWLLLNRQVVDAGLWGEVVGWCLQHRTPGLLCVLSRLHLEGGASEEKDREVRGWLQEAGEHVDALLLLGWLRAEGRAGLRWGKVLPPREWVQLKRLSPTEGHFRLGMWWKKRHGAFGQLLMLVHLQHARKGGGAEVSDQLGTFLARFPFARVQAADALHDAFLKGRKDAALKLARLHLRFPKDVHEARIWWEKAADAGFVEAQFELACLQLTGRGGDLNPTAGLGNLRKASSAGDIRAMRLLAVTLLKGPPQGHLEAVQVLRALQQAGDPTGTLWLARCLARGRGTRRDVREALSLYGQLPAKRFHGVRLEAFALRVGMLGEQVKQGSQYLRDLFR